MGRWVLLIAALSAGLWGYAPGVFRPSPPPFGGERRLALAQEIVAGWPQTARLTGAAMLERYGPPDALAANGIGWENRGRWKRIIVRDSEGPSGAGVLEQTVEYAVPEEKIPEVAGFAPGLRVSREGRWMSARSDDEALNYLTLNLADGIGRGLLDAPRAREFQRAAVELSRAGKTSPLMEGLLFLPPSP